MIDSAAASTIIRRRLSTPAPIWLTVVLGAAILAAPAWLLREDFRNYSLLHDDFDYIAQLRNWPTTWGHLFEPHNAHVVPIFRIWTCLLVSISGGLANVPAVFARSSYAGLIAAMLALAWVVARETRQPAAGLSAMAILGISTVIHPAVTWYSASQALWAAAAILVTIASHRPGQKRGVSPARGARWGNRPGASGLVWRPACRPGGNRLSVLQESAPCCRASSTPRRYHILFRLPRPVSLAGPDPWQPNAVGKAVRRLAAACSDSAAHGAGSH